MDRKIIWYNIVPIVFIHLLFLPLWFIRSSFLMYNLSMWEIGFNLGVLPIYLIIVNTRYAAREGHSKFIPYIALMWATALIGNALAYLNWGISSGHLFSPDVGTMDLFRMLIGVNLVSILVLGFISQGVLYWYFQRPSNPVA